MALTYEDIQNKLTAQFGNAVKDYSESYGMLTFEIDREKLLEVVRYLRDDETLRFNFLTTLAACTFPITNWKGSLPACTTCTTG